MGTICSKRKNSSDDNASENSEEQGRTRDSPKKENPQNHADVSKRQNGGGGGGAGSSSQPSEGPSGGTAGQSKDAAAAKFRKGGDSSFSDSMSSPTNVDIPHPFDLPMELKKQTDNVQNLMLGRVARVKPVLKGRKITIYICASFSQDFRLEKGSFHTTVYPSLREYCATRGYELHTTDLHWKADMERQQDHEFPELCLGELQRQLEVSYVIPILFLSNSLGESLLPKTVEQQDFQMTLKNVNDEESKGLLEKWYELDTQAEPPCYRLKPVSVHLPKIRSTVEEEKNEAISSWREIVEQILSILLRVFPTELRDTYLTTVIEQEIHNSIFMNREVARRSIWVNRVFPEPGSNDDIQSALDKEKARRLETLHQELKNQLKADHILRLLVKWEKDGLSQDNAEHASYLQDLSSQLSTQLTSVIDDIIEEDKAKVSWNSLYGVDGLLCSELMQQSIFCQQSAKCSIPLENILNTVKQFISSNKSYPLVVHGVKGCGKTSLISRAIQQCLTWFPETLIVYRFVGITPESSSMVQILQSILSQLSFLLTGRSYWIPHNATCYRKELLRLVSGCCPQKSTVVIVIDGVDELTSSELAWICEEVPARVKIILSCSEETPVYQFIKFNLKHEDAFISIPSPSQTVAEGLLSATLLQYCHSADANLQKKITSRLKHCTLPLYIKVLAWLASIENGGSDAALAEIKDAPSIINYLFDCLEKSLGKEKVEHALTFLVASRHGLCDSEILDLLAHSELFSSKVTLLDWAPASLFLAQLLQKLGPFLEWELGSGVSLTIRWRDQLVKEIAKERYLGKRDTQQQRKARSTIIDYFMSKWKDTKNGRFIPQPSEPEPGNSHQRRKLVEIPFQEFHSSGSITSKYLCNLPWLLEKLQGCSVHSVIEDILLEAKGDVTSLNKDVSLLLKMLEMSAQGLSHDGRQLFSQIYGRLKPLFDSSSSEVSGCPFIKQIYDECLKPRVASFIPTSPSVLYPLSVLTQDSSFGDLAKGEAYFDQITRLQAGNSFAISLSTNEEEMVVWNLAKVQPVRTMKGVQNPNTLKIIDAVRVVVLCGRELQIFNIDDLCSITKLKGLLNQKMPYFGLHDENHIVSISRNRMYVTMMNVMSGETTSTFKVGEDRFLNSLIISENGKILVCGDETQKPFPLLVWDLTSRKLVYDLRIPHHEFLPQYSAITKEGHFVACVCREVDDPGPNFIVVYDLQSGTLFKKWKPGSNTHAVAISGQGGCVINSLENNLILVWDLVTGTCKHSLTKHSAPVDTLLLDKAGVRCLSSDSLGRDRTVCLWDLSTGQLLALFTPDLPISTCELSNDGCAVIFGFKGRKTVEVVRYKTKSSSDKDDEDASKETFGKEENLGKITDLKATQQ